MDTMHGDNAELLALQRIDETCTTLQEQGKYLEALECMERGLVLRQHFFGADSDEVWRACKRARRQNMMDQARADSTPFFPKNSGAADYDDKPKEKKGKKKGDESPFHIVDICHIPELSLLAVSSTDLHLTLWFVQGGERTRCCCCFCCC